MISAGGFFLVLLGDKSDPKTGNGGSGKWQMKLIACQFSAKLPLKEENDETKRKTSCLRRGVLC